MSSIKVCVASSGAGGLEDSVSMQFGRCPMFTVITIENGSVVDVRTVPNPGSSASGGAGIQAAQAVVNEGCSVVIAGAFGPNAEQVLRAGGVEMLSAQGSIENAVKSYLEGSLSPPVSGRGGRKGRGFGRHM